MRNLAITTAGTVLAIGLVAAPALAQNAKIGTATADLTDLKQGASWVYVDGMTTDIRVPQQTNLSIDVALQCSLATDTTVRTKGGDKASANAQAGIKVRVEIQALDDGNPVGPKTYAYPNADVTADENTGITYCQRSQTLEAILQGQIDLDSCTQSGSFVAGDCTLSDEEIRLVLSTLSAHAFNFFTPDLTSGDYRVRVEANPETSTEVIEGDIDAEPSEALAAALIGQGSMVIDEVRFGSLP